MHLIDTFNHTIEMYLNIRNDFQINTYQTHFEVLSLNGTICDDGTHLHIALSDEDGKVIGGHVVSDLVVHTTMEVVLGESLDAKLSREYDQKTGYNELVVKKL